MQLSVIIPAYNEAKYLPTCLTSLIAEIKRNQHRSIEIIVVDNASTDNTTVIVKQYSEVTLIKEPRKGLVFARQAGFVAAHGDLLANIDADTIVPIGWINTIYQEFTHCPNLVALSGPQKYYDLPKRINFFVSVFYRLAYLVYLINRYIFKISSLVQGGNFIVTKAALNKIGGYNTKEFTFYGEDADLARRLFKIGLVKFSLNFKIFSSARRLVAEGLLTMGLRYAINYLWVVFFKKPFNKTYLDIRLGNLPYSGKIIRKRLLHLFARFFSNVKT
ncbi:MAG: glycosyltransferase family A protein [Patescibacteria group bacterium]|jgi:glycosyltransferase involved in cell wall biosynthesis